MPATLPQPRCALIVAHGSPADPAPQQAAVATLAAAVAKLLPGWQVQGATLAAPGALEQALRTHPPALIYPLFMAEGWFTASALPRRLAAAGSTARQLPAFGTDPALADLVAQAALEGARAAGLAPHQTTLLLAAHGSPTSPGSETASRAMAATIAARQAFAAVTSGFLEQPPFLDDAARNLGPALCLPLFALRAGHVARDLPAALADAGFTGPLLAPIGEHPAVARLIARTLAPLSG